MNTNRTVKALLGASLLTIMFQAVLWPSTTQAENYVGGQIGLTLPSLSGGLSNIDITSQFPSGTTLSDLDLKESLLYGGKIGHYFQSARWFGLETEVFNTNPGIKQQVQTFTAPTGSASGTLQGAHMRVIMWAPVNFMFRYPKSRLQPYVGVGPGLFFARINGEGVGAENPTSTSSNGKIGLNAKVGVEYYMTRRVTAFAEWKYNYARFKFSENSDLFPFPYAFNATYSMHNVAFGIAYHF